ncbi:glycosyltransferase, group 2 family protein [Prevotella sp. DNF00663]|uniref:glycosyltransferase n=1 Tax=unclassified Prevotella TaxID=2638335 RepID=UPI00068A755A|nr:MULTISPECIES: glycosyltransferase [unclassified Prevotella]KXB83602.1 glycosyltransferase, group 2 family protein [Prevotella sp. DNF00663]
MLEKSTKTNIELSVIVPVYNVEDTLNRCLESIAGQQILAMEIILVDDGSTDGSADICHQWKEKDDRVVVVHQSNAGLSAARNVGIAIAHGRYITFVDSDDVVSDHTYSQLLNILAQHAEYDMLEYPVSLHHDSDDQCVLSFQEAVYTDMTMYWFQTEAYRHAYAWNKIYRKSLFDDVKYPVGRLFEDIYTLPILLKKASCVATTSQGLYGYHDNPKGLTALADGAAYEALLDAQLNVFNGLVNYKDSEALSRYYLHLLNIQITVCRLTGKQPILLDYRAKVLNEFNWIGKLKIVLLRLLGIKFVCRLFSIVKV